jgi:putative heme iron utilization protein
MICYWLDPISDARVATVHEPPALVPRIAEVPEQSIAAVPERPAVVAPMTECEQIWDQMTHMTRKEWAEACRRVDDEKSKLEISDGASILPWGGSDHRRASN